MELRILWYDQVLRGEEESARKIGLRGKARCGQTSVSKLSVGFEGKCLFKGVNLREVSWQLHDF